MLSLAKLQKTYNKKKRGYQKLKKQNAEVFVHKYYASKVAKYGALLSIPFLLFDFIKIAGIILALSLWMLSWSLHGYSKGPMRTINQLEKSR